MAYQRGSRGEDVKRLQQQLKDAGFDVGPVDGIFGPRTEAAVNAFRARHGLPQNGLWDESAWSKLPGVGGGGGSDIEARIRQEFPGLAPFLDIPELRDLLTRGANEGWTSERFLAEVRGTDWWRGRGQVSQEWGTLSPQEQQLRIDEQSAKVFEYMRDQYGTQWMVANGYTDPKNNHIRHLAGLVVSGQQTWEMIASEMLSDAMRHPGTIAQTNEMARQEELARKAKRPEEIAEELWRTARGEYFVNINKDLARDFANRILNGQSSVGEFKDYLRAEAKRMYAGHAEAIDNGILPRDLFSPALDILGRELEMSEEAILGNNKLWGQITAQAAQQKGQFTAADWVKYARSQTEWDRTMNANQMADEWGTRIEQMFGRTA
jgi:peptidoglycan hydrolase-like protein with peptidoglycan-binding domain